MTLYQSYRGVSVSVYTGIQNLHVMQIVIVFCIAAHFTRLRPTKVHPGYARGMSGGYTSAVEKPVHTRCSRSISVCYEKSLIRHWIYFFIMIFSWLPLSWHIEWSFQRYLRKTFFVSFPKKKSNHEILKQRFWLCYLNLFLVNGFVTFFCSKQISKKLLHSISIDSHSLWVVKKIRVFLVSKLLMWKIDFLALIPML